MKPLTKTSTRRSSEASHFSQMPLSRKQHQTAHFGLLSKQIGRANNDPNAVCKNSHGESGLPFLHQFSRNWKKALSLQAQMTLEKCGNPHQEEKQNLRAKTQQLQKEQNPHPHTSVLRSVLPSPSAPPDSAGGTSKSTAVLQSRHRSVNMVIKKTLMKISWLVVSIYWQIQSKSFKQEV